MIDQLRIGDKYSYDDFGASVAERKIGKPKKKTIKETVPHSNITYDFSRINGEIYWEERELQYILELDAETPEELEDLKIDLSNWLMNVFEEDLFDPYIEDYHFKATYEDIDFDDSEVIKTTATVKFKAYPYMISNAPTKHTITIGDVGTTVNENENMTFDELGKHYALGVRKFHFANPFTVYLHDSVFDSIKYTFEGVICVEQMGGSPSEMVYVITYENEGRSQKVTISPDLTHIGTETIDKVINKDGTLTAEELTNGNWGYFSLANQIELPHGGEFVTLTGEIFVDKCSPSPGYTTIYSNEKKYVCSRWSGVVEEITDASGQHLGEIHTKSRSARKVIPTIRATTPVTITKGGSSVSISRYTDIKSELLSLEPGDNVLSVFPSLFPDMLTFFAPGQVTLSYEEEVL